MTDRLRRGVAILADLLVLLLVVLVAFVVVSGGGTYEAGGLHLRITSVDNPLILITALLAVRFRIRQWAPLLGLVPVERVAAWAQIRCAAFDALARSAPLRPWTTAVAGIFVASLVLKLWLAWMHPGFHRGDDVEIHEMTIGTLLREPWPVWTIRSPAFPMAFIYPVQYVARLAGVNDIGNLVFAGRAVVAVLSTLCVWITWRLGRRVLAGAAGYAVLAVALLAANKLQMAFGSSEMPNPIAAVLAVSAFALLLRPGPSAALAAGALLGIAATFRFSEVVLFVPAVLGLMWQGRWLHAILTGGAAVITASAVLAGADAWYWGAPFFSVRQAIEFTVVQRQSSGGFQSALWYVGHVSRWSTWVVVALAVFATRRTNLTVALWAWTPIALLSLFPHKEERYLITVTPFVCLLAADGVRRLLDTTWTGLGSRGRPAVLELAVVAALSISLAHELGSWRLRRSDVDVALARDLIGRDIPAGATVAIEQAWRTGGQLYLPGRRVEGVDAMGAAALLDRSRMPEWILLDRSTVERHGYADRLGSLGYGEIRHTSPSTYRVFARMEAQARAAMAPAAGNDRVRRRGSR